MTKILVAKSFLKFFFYDEKLIPRKNIVEIKKDLIVVKNTAGSIKVKANNAKNPKEKEKRKLHVDPAPTPG